MLSTAIGQLIPNGKALDGKEPFHQQWTVPQIVKLCQAFGILRSTRQRALNVSFVRWFQKTTRSRGSLVTADNATESRQLSIDFTNMNITETIVSPGGTVSRPQSRHRSLIIDAEAVRQVNDQSKIDDVIANPRRRSMTKHASLGRRGSVILIDTLPRLDTSTLVDAGPKGHEVSPVGKLSPNGLGVDPDLNDISNLSESLSRSQIRVRWKEAVKKIRELARISASRDLKQQSEPSPDTSERLEPGSMCSRPIDYFIVFGVHPPKEFRDINFQNWNESQIENVLRKSQVFAGIVDRYPREDYKDCPVSDVWTSLAFPTGILLSWVRRPPKSHFAVVTFADGRKCFLTFLQFDQPISALLDISLKPEGKELYTPKAICIVSQYPHLNAYRKMLSQLYSVASSPSYPIPVERFISQITMELPLPVPDKIGVSVVINDPNDPITFYASPLRDPLVSRLPLCLLFDILGVDSILGIFSAMMFEQRILLHSNSLSALTIVCQTMLQLLYPFQWSSVYVPVLAELMLDAYQCPQPYIQGVHTKYLSQFTDLNDIVLVDLDHDLIRCSSPLPRLPQQAGSALWARLGQIMERRCSERDYVAVRAEDPYSQSTSSKFDKEVMNAFLMFHADLMTGFRRFLFFINDVPFFNGTGFLKSKNFEDGSYEFLTKVIESRAFDGFLEQESEPSLYSDFLATGDTRILEKIHEIEDRAIEYHHMKQPKPVPESKRSQSTYAFVSPLRIDLINSVQRVQLTSTQGKMTASTRKVHKKRPHQDARAGQHDQMQYYMSQIFSNEGLSEKDAVSISHLLKHESARKCLSSILKQPLVKGSDLCLSDSSFTALAATLQQMLECCMEVQDFVNASSVIDASMRFFCEDFSGSKVFIESVIKDHPLWLIEEFWDKFAEISLSQTFPDRNSHKESTANWLMNTSHKMLTFGVSSESVTQTVVRIASAHDLPLQRIDELKKLIINAAQAMAAVD